MSEQGTRFAMVATLLRHELRQLLRDRRTVIFSILLPVVVMPILLFSGLMVEKRTERKLRETTFHYAVTGDEADLARTLIAEGLAGREADPDALPLKLQEHQVDDVEVSLEAEEVFFYLECLDPDQARRFREKQAGEATQDDGEAARTSSARQDPEQEPTVPLIRILYREDRNSSREGVKRLRELLAEVRRDHQEALLQKRDFPIDTELVAAVNTVDIATSAARTGLTIGKLLTALIIGFILMGGSVLAADTIAGEKERGTLETLLTTAASRVDIVTAKQLAILTAAVAVTVIQVVNLLVYVGFGVIPVAEDFAIEVSVADAVLLLVLFLPAAALVSNVLLLVSGRSRSYKETQLYFLPIFMIGMLLSVASVLPGISLRSAIALVPIANTSVAVREVLVGTHDWLFLLIGWLVTAAAAVWTGRITQAALSTEYLITANDSDLVTTDRAARFPRGVLRWVAVIWALLFLGVGIPAINSAIERQVLFNMVLLMGGGTLLMLRRYRLDVRQALSLRAPRPLVWLAVLVGAPAGLLTTVGIAQLANIFLPVPEEMMKQLSETLFPEEVPIRTLVLLIVVAPAFFEEIFFRGMVLHGLRDRLRPLPLFLVVGLAFALYHLDLFRIIPVWMLGIMLTAVVWLSGSIFPAMLWHAIHNGIGLLVVTSGLPIIEELGPLQFIYAAILLVVSLWIIARNRLEPAAGQRE